MTTDVAERTETQTDTQAQQAVETQAREGTDNTQAVQTETGSEQESTERSTPSRREQRLQALADAEREEARETGRSEALEEIQRNQTKANRDSQKTRFKESYPTTVRTMRGILNRSIDEGRPLSTEEAQQVLNAFDGHNLVAWEANAEEASDLIRDGILGLLPKGEHEEFGKRTVNPDGSGVDLATYFTTAVEMAAPHSKWAKGLDLESAGKASAKLRKELEAAKLEAHDEGFEEGLNAPPGTSPDGGKSAQRSAPGNKTYVQLEEGYGNGTLTAEEEKLYKQMRADRASRR